MKHQYFGDVSDYKKYSVLRAISNNGSLKTMVAWMLTPNDQRNDGNVNSYLKAPGLWRQFEPDIFDFLYNAVVTNSTKDLHLVEKSGLIASTNYFWDLLADDIAHRQLYFENLLRASKDHQLIFLDPDNGIATSSVKKGRKDSSKYVFLDEISALWQRQHSLLIYQHFPRVNRTEYIKRKVEEIKDTLGNSYTYAIQTTHMVYFLVPRENHAIHFEKLKDSLERRWEEKIKVDKC